MKDNAMKIKFMLILFILFCMNQVFADSNQALFAVKNFSCTAGGTIENYFIKKVATQTIKDLGWSTATDQNGYVIQKTLQIGNLIL
jgi:hypothetical protein